MKEDLIVRDSGGREGCKGVRECGRNMVVPRVVHALLCGPGSLTGHASRARTVAFLGGDLSVAAGVRKKE